MKTNMRVSIVIPVYNEAEQITDCLAAIARQTVKPYEVIVVDNNSTDGTAASAARFPLVRVLRETRQGVVYARDHGFNAAKGEIIGRIDADTIIANDWVATLGQLFTDGSLDLVTGSVSLRQIGLARLASRIDLFWRCYFYERLGPQVGLQGANMALRRTVWETVRHDLCHEHDMHEDFDLGIHATMDGFKAVFAESLRVSICHRQIQSGFIPFAKYALTSPRTYLRHGLKSGRYMYRGVVFVLVLYPIIYLLCRGYDSQLKQFSFAALFTHNLVPRVNPAAYLDY